MRHGSLFSGIGGFDLASEWMGWENVFQVEIDDYCQKVLTKNFPNVKRYGDIKEFKGQPGSVDIISGGFPCQPFSHAGKRKGKSDDRYLWPEYLRIIQEIRPTYVVGENVAGLISMEDGKILDGIFTDLEGEGYTIESFIIPACGIGAWHRRERIWIIAYYESRRLSRAKQECNIKEDKRGGRCNAFKPNQSRIIRKDVSDSSSTGGTGKTTNEADRCSRNNRRENPKILQWKRSEQAKNGVKFWEAEPSMGRVAHGVPRRVDRIKGLGNAIVPQIAFELFKAIDHD